MWQVTGAPVMRPPAGGAPAAGGQPGGFPQPGQGPPRPGGPPGGFPGVRPGGVPQICATLHDLHASCIMKHKIRMNFSRTACPGLHRFGLLLLTTFGWSGNSADPCLGCSSVWQLRLTLATPSMADAMLGALTPMFEPVMHDDRSTTTVPGRAPPPGHPPPTGHDDAPGDASSRHASTRGESSAFGSSMLRIAGVHMQWRVGPEHCSAFARSIGVASPVLPYVHCQAILHKLNRVPY